MSDGQLEGVGGENFPRQSSQAHVTKVCQKCMPEGLGRRHWVSRWNFARHEVETACNGDQ